MPLSAYAYDNFVVQEYSALTDCLSLPVGPDFPDVESWLSSFVLNTIFRVPLPQDRAALGFALIRRAQGSIEDFDAGCQLLQEFIKGESGIQPYFRCLQKFEMAAHQTYQAFDVGRKVMNIQLFEKGDGSPLQRLNEIYNVSRHHIPTKLPPKHLHPLWLRNDGLFCEKAYLKYSELRELICSLAHIAKSIAHGDTSV